MDLITHLQKIVGKPVSDVLSILQFQGIWATLDVPVALLITQGI